MTTDLYTKQGRKVVQRNRDKVAESALAAQGMHPLLAMLFGSRGMGVADVSLDIGRLPVSDSLEGATEAGIAIAESVAAKERIVIVGDYDADGATSTACFLRALRQIGADVTYLVPDRKKGYGLSAELAEQAHAIGGKTLITVDNGVVAFAGVKRAKELGLKVIITDHHLPADTLPNADVLVNQHIKGSKFKGRNLAGVGVAYYVLSATRKALATKGLPSFNILQLADLVSIGTVGDVVPLDMTNRILVDIGLNRMRQGNMSPGVEALIRISGKEYADANTEMIGFQLAPRINASGRLATANASIDLLSSTSQEESLRLASELDAINSERKSMQRDMSEIAEIMGKLGTTAKSVMVVHNAEFAEGIVGLLASKLKETHAKPSAVFTTAEDGHLKGSFRSIPGVHIRDAIALVDSRYPGLLIKFGGHAMAAGATIDSNGLKKFERALDEAVQEIALPNAFNPEYETDGAMPSGCLNLQVTELLAKQHWGSGFPPPVFEDVFQVVDQRTIGSEKQHSKLVLERHGERFDAIYFNHDDVLPKSVRFIYRPSINVWNQEKKMQLMIETHIVDFKPTLEKSPVEKEVKNEPAVQVEPKESPKKKLIF